MPYGIVLSARSYHHFAHSRRSRNDDSPIRSFPLNDLPLTTAQEPSVDDNDYLTREQTKDRLHVSFMTLRKYEKSRKLVPCRFGRRVLYRKQDVEAALARSRY